MNGSVEQPHGISRSRIRRLRAALSARFAFGVALHVVLVAGPLTVCGSEGPPAVLNPKTYSSPSGDYVLTVEPSDMFGCFDAHYTMHRNGREVWCGQKPVTLWEAYVTDDGLVAGFGYTLGLSGCGPHPALNHGPDGFHVVILDAQGEFILHEQHARQQYGLCGTPFLPLGDGGVADSEHDRFILRLSTEDSFSNGESWWIYRLSTGERLTQFVPRQLMPDADRVGGVIKTQQVKGTPLALVHWSLPAWKHAGEESGARFTLVDETGSAVWSLDLPDDYTHLARARRSRRAYWSVWDEGAFLSSDRQKRFDLHFVREKQRVAFSVDQDNDGHWVVSEVGRTDYVQPTAEIDADLAEISEEPLLYLGDVVLSPPQEPEVCQIRGVRRFDIDDKGRIYFLRSERGDSPALVLADQTGKVLKEVCLAVAGEPECMRYVHFAWVGGDRCVLVRCQVQDQCDSGAWWVDFSTGTVKEIPGYSYALTHHVAGFGDGGFVAIVCKGRRQAQCRNTLAAFTAEGELDWVLADDSIPDPQWGLGGAGLAVTDNGTIAVLSQTPAWVQLFDRTGKYVSTIRFEEALGRTVSYPTELAADIDNGLVIRDFRGHPPIIRMSVDGSLRSQATIRHPDGRTFSAHDIAVAPDGRLWTCDGYSLLRLSDDGVVDLILGRPPDPDVMGRLVEAALGPEAKIYAVAERTFAVHVFGPDGGWQTVCKPTPTDFNDFIDMPRLAVSDAGDVYLGLGDRRSRGLSQRREEYLHFAHDGTRLGEEHLGIDWPREDWYFQPGTGNRWVVGYQDVFLADPDGNVIRKIAKRSDGTWIECPGHASVASDGSIAVVVGPVDTYDDGGDVYVNVYSATAEPGMLTKLPACLGSFPRLGYDNGRLVAAGNEYLVVFDETGRPVRRLALSAKLQEGRNWQPFVVNGGRELLLFGGIDTSTLRRYSLP